MALAAKGLSGTAQPGFELLDKQKLGASSFQQQVAYQRALEGQIAQTIGQIDGVSGAQVQLTMPQDQLFADEQKPATAAVLLGGGASTLDGSAVRGIANLVASSVPNLKTARRHDHRRHRPDALAARRRRRRRRQALQAGRRGALRERACRPR